LYGTLASPAERSYVGHAPRDRMNGVQDFDAAFLELIGKRFDTVLRLCDRHPVSRHEDYLGSVGEHHRDVVGARRSDLLRAAATRGGLRSAAEPNAPKSTLVSGRFIARLIATVKIVRWRRRARRK